MGRHAPRFANAQERVRTPRHRHACSRVRGMRRAPGMQLVSPHRVAKGLERLSRVPLEWRLHEAHDAQSAHAYTPVSMGPRRLQPDSRSTRTAPQARYGLGG